MEMHVTGEARIVFPLRKKHVLQTVLNSHIDCKSSTNSRGPKIAPTVRL